MLLRMEGSVRFPPLWGERIKRWRNYLLWISINVSRLQSKEKSHCTRVRTTAPLLSLQKGSLAILKQEQRRLEWCLRDQCQQYPRDRTSSFHRVHRMAHVGRQLWRLPGRTVLLKQGHPAQVAQDHAQMASEDLQGCSWLLTTGTFVATSLPAVSISQPHSQDGNSPALFPARLSAARPQGCLAQASVLGKLERSQEARSKEWASLLPAWHHNMLPTTLLTLRAAATLWFRTEAIRGCQQRQPDVAALCVANINPS